MNRATFADDVEFGWAVLFFAVIGLGLLLAWCLKQAAVPLRLLRWIARTGRCWE